MPEGLNIPTHESHLKKGVKPIVACLGTMKDFGLEERNKILNHFETTTNNAHNVDFKRSIKGAISQPDRDSDDKFSEGIYDCTALVVAGTEKGTGRQISLMTHQDPKEFLITGVQGFKDRLSTRLAEFKNKCEEGTVDAVLVGGQYAQKPYDAGVAKAYQLADATRADLYVGQIQMLAEVVQGVLHFKPLVINGPKVKLGHFDDDRIYYKNKGRQLYFFRSEIDHTIGSNLAGDFE